MSRCEYCRKKSNKHRKPCDVCGLKLHGCCRRYNPYVARKAFCPPHVSEGSGFIDGGGI